MRSDTIDSIRIELSGGLKNWLVEGKNPHIWCQKC